MQSLKPRLEPYIDLSVWFVRLDPETVEAEGVKNFLARWHRFEKKHCDGEDGMGRYYRDQDHAIHTIRDFNKRERARKNAPPNQRHRRPTESPQSPTP